MLYGETEKICCKRYERGMYVIFRCKNMMPQIQRLSGQNEEA
jgi:hypothetical protein